MQTKSNIRNFHKDFTPIVEIAEVGEASKKNSSAIFTTGFTLIELLVVISIISLLSSIVFSNVQESQAKARDVNRIAQVDQAQKALNLYHLDNKNLPGTAGTVYKEGTVAYSDLMDDLVQGEYLSAPITSNSGDEYVYVRTGDNSSVGGILGVDVETEGSIGIGGSCSQPSGHSIQGAFWGYHQLTIVLNLDPGAMAGVNEFYTVNYPSSISEEDLNPAQDWVSFSLNTGEEWIKRSDGMCDYNSGMATPDDDGDDGISIVSCPDMGGLFEIGFATAYYESSSTDVCEGLDSYCACVL